MSQAPTELHDTRDPVGFIVSLDGRFFGPFATAGEAVDFERSYEGHTYTGPLYHPVDREHFTGEIDRCNWSPPVGQDMKGVESDG